MLTPQVLAHGTLKKEEKSLGYIIMPKLDVTLETFLESFSGLERAQKVI